MQPDVFPGIPGKLFRVTSAAAASGTSAAAASGSYTPSVTATNRLAVTHFSGASSVSAAYTVESPAGTVIWQLNLSGTNNGFTQNWDPPLYVTTVGQAVVFKCGAMASTNTGTVNGAGFEVTGG